MGIFTKLVKGIAGAQKEALSAQKELLSGLLGGREDQPKEQADQEIQEAASDEDEDNDVIVGRQRRVNRRGGRTSEDDPNEDYESSPRYQGELDLEDFCWQLVDHKLAEGDIYKVRGKFFDLAATEIVFDDNGILREFFLVWRAPKLEAGQQVTFYCEVTDDSYPLFLRVEGRPCHKCGAMMDPGTEFCPSCGAKAAKVFYANCGAAFEEGEKICAKCGTNTSPYQENNTLADERLPAEYEEIDLSGFN
jgi:RNA polymerase subunit RPABC4/transcription elongation factor Spt4